MKNKTNNSYRPAPGKPRTLVEERKSLCSKLADIVVLALLVIFFFGFLAFDYELLGFHKPITIITIPNQTEQYFEAIPWIIFGVLVFDTVKENFVRAVDEIAKVQPQYSQAFSNLQLDYIQTVKNTIQNTISAQKQLVGSWNNMPVSTTPYAEQFSRQTNEITNNTLRAVDINNQLAFNAVDAARENVKIYNRTISAVTEFSTNIAKTCTALSNTAAQQQQQSAKQ